MDKQMLSMEELEQVNGGNIITDAWDWIHEKIEDIENELNPLKPIITNPIIASR